MIKNMPYTTSILDKVVEEVKKLDLETSEKLNNEFMAGFELAKKRIVDKINKLEL